MADSLDSGSSVLYGRAGSSPASRTKETVERLFLFYLYASETGLFHQMNQCPNPLHISADRNPFVGTMDSTHRLFRDDHKGTTSQATTTADQFVSVGIRGRHDCRRQAHYISKRRVPTDHRRTTVVVSCGNKFSDSCNTAQFLVHTHLHSASKFSVASLSHKRLRQKISRSSGAIAAGNGALAIAAIACAGFPRGVRPRFVKKKLKNPLLHWKERVLFSNIAALLFI